VEGGSFSRPPLEHPDLSAVVIDHDGLLRYELAPFADIGDGSIQGGSSYRTEHKAPVERLARLWKAGAFGYDPRFAMEKREDGRLDAFRGFLRRTWRAIDGSPSPDKAEQQSRELRDELTQEYLVARVDWDAIKNRYDDRVRRSGRDIRQANLRNRCGVMAILLIIIR
jgi:hypothetical protein